MINERIEWKQQKKKKTGENTIKSKKYIKTIIFGKERWCSVRNRSNKNLYIFLFLLLHDGTRNEYREISPTTFIVQYFEIPDEDKLNFIEATGKR